MSEASLAQRFVLSLSVLILLIVVVLGATTTQCDQQPHNGYERASQENHQYCAANGIMLEASAVYHVLHDYREDINAFATSILALFTVVLALATIFLWKSSEKHAVHMADSVKAAKLAANVAEQTLIASQRPWISVQVMLDRPLRLEKNGSITISLAFTLANVGNSPALFAWPYARAVLAGPKVDLLKTQRQLLAETRQSGNPYDLGLTVFPGNPVSTRMTVTISPSDLENIDKGKGLIFPNIVGFVDYQFSFNEERRETGFVYMLVRPKGSNIAIPVNETEIPTDQLALVPWIASARAFRAT